MTTQMAPIRTLESVYDPVLAELEKLIRLVRSGTTSTADFNDAFFLLETLPLTSDEFGIARLRLINAKRYRDAKENGASRWEIRTVMLQLHAKVTAGHRFLHTVRRIGLRWHALCRHGIAEGANSSIASCRSWHTHHQSDDGSAGADRRFTYPSREFGNLASGHQAIEYLSSETMGPSA